MFHQVHSPKFQSYWRSAQQPDPRHSPFRMCRNKHPSMSATDVIGMVEIKGDRKVFVPDFRLLPITSLNYQIFCVIITDYAWATHTAISENLAISVWLGIIYNQYDFVSDEAKRTAEVEVSPSLPSTRDNEADIFEGIQLGIEGMVADMGIIASRARDYFRALHDLAPGLGQDLHIRC